MLGHVNGYYERVLEELRKAFHEERTEREIAGSFAVGIFITALPTLGTGFLVFAALIRYVESVSRLALLSSVAVMNPIVKPLVYIASINLGSIVVTRDIALVTDPETILLFLLVGNLIIAVAAAVVGYVLALAAVRRYRAADMHVVEEALEELEHEVEGKLERTEQP